MAVPCWGCFNPLPEPLSLEFPCPLACKKEKRKKAKTAYLRESPSPSEGNLQELADPGPPGLCPSEEVLSIIGSNSVIFEVRVTYSDSTSLSESRSTIYRPGDFR